MLQIRDVMTREVVTVTPDTTLREAAELLTHHHVTGAPVVAGHDVVGIVSATDLLDFIASHEHERPRGEVPEVASDDEGVPDNGENEAPSAYFEEAEPAEASSDENDFHFEGAPGADALTEHTIADVMTRDVCWLPPDASVADAARYMWQVGIHRLLVLEGGRLRGILSMSDVARVLATES